MWTSFDSAIELTLIVRKTESEEQLRHVLMLMTTYTTTPQQVHWLQKFQWHNLRISHGAELLLHDPAPLPDIVFVRFPGYKGPPYSNEDPRLAPITPVSWCTECPCRCKRLQVPLGLHRCQGMTVGTG